MGIGIGEGGWGVKGVAVWGCEGVRAGVEWFMIMNLWGNGDSKGGCGVLLGEGTEHTSESWRWGWCFYSGIMEPWKSGFWRGIDGWYTAFTPFAGKSLPGSRGGS